MSPTPMMTVPLFNRDGTKQVGTVDIPPTKMRSDVLVVGNLYFLWSPERETFCQIVGFETKPGQAKNG